MRFMGIVKSSKDSEAGVMPSEEMLAAMAKYNEDLVEGRGDARWERPAGELERRARQVLRGQAHGD